MPKKSFKENTSHLDRFFSEPSGTDSPQRTQETDGTHDDQPPIKKSSTVPSTPITPPAVPITPKCYRLNLKLKAEYKDYLAEASWAARKSITEYINDLIEADKATKNT